MKSTFVVIILFVALAIAGCSDQTSVTGPVNNDRTPTLSTIDPGQGGETRLTVDRIVYVPETSSLYHLSGTIAYSFVVDQALYLLATSTDLVVTDLNPDKASYTVVDKKEHTGTIGEGETTRTTEDYTIDPNVNLTLRVEYAVGSRATLENLIVFMNVSKDSPARTE